MIAVDTNLLVHAHREDSEWHDAAFARVAGLAEGNAAWAVPWPCVHEFLSIATHPRIYDPPTPIAGPKVHDARIAALCLEHGVRELWTADRDFGRFPDLRRNPLLSFERPD